MPLCGTRSIGKGHDTNPKLSQSTHGRRHRCRIAALIIVRTPRQQNHTFATQLASLDDNTRIYPGHDYIYNNLEFTLAREPDNAQAQALLGQIADQDPADALVSTLGQEKHINTFFRLHSPSLIAQLREDFPDLPEDPDPQTVFLKLRELRNSW